MKPAEIPHLDKALVDKAVSLWRAGELVAFPTETVYGLGADATNALAVAKIYEVKARPRFNPLIVHVADKDIAQRYAQWNARAEKLAHAFWPGPLTLVLKRTEHSPIADLVSAGGDTVALRASAHPVARALLDAFNGGIAAPSANRSGRISPTTASHVREELASTVPLIVDGGACEVGLESTVVDVSDETSLILRPGSITREMVEKVIGPLGNKKSVGAPRSPGQLESHYAPSIKLRLNADSVRNNEALLAFGPQPFHGAARSINLSATGNLAEAAANLFAALRALDDARYAAIAVMPIPDSGIGEAINDRLRRASAR